ncbi:hypothetical protein VQ03_06140 [Methylobacterium tarhaniae]|uniref:TonB C-terminal domain-containing protein n=1 Tax=Methylobacterium tarhaniae TaxID=1187852 RepID=A0A0J6T939_9HYPH|nr:energy transducer TonB [Methylobacterium tarhaniae]KMO43900.1 hypothetical protein VQ03_06140 [Methylobacterium tarhaniae]
MSHTVTTDAPEPREPGAGLGIAFLVALALHAGGLFALTYWRAAPSPPGENEITIDLAPDMAAVDVPNEAQDIENAPVPTDVTEPTTVPTAEPPSDTVPVETPPETKAEEVPQETMVEQAPAEAVPVEKPPEAVEAVQEPEEQVVTSTSQEAPAAVVAQPVTEPKPIPKPVPKPVAKPKPVEKPRPVEKPVEAKKPAPKPVRDVKREAQKAAERNAEAARARRAAASTSQMNQGGASAAASANAARAWGQMIVGAIRSRVRGAAGASGTVTVRFTVARSGRVLGASLIGSSGNGSLDAAALSAASGSLPPAPADFAGAQQSFSVPLRFN